MIRRLAIILAAISSLAVAQDAEPAKPTAEPAKPTAESAKPVVEQLDATRYRIGEVILDQKSREIRFPSKVNMSQGLIEYLMVLPKGKIHEALLVSEISPTHLNLAFTLLGYQASPELFPLLDADGHMTNKLPVVRAAVKTAARIRIEVEWSEDGKTRRIPVNDWIQHVETESAMKPGPWLYTGGDFQEGAYMPERSGDFGAIMVDSGALINYPGSDNGDNVWYGFPKRVPPVATPVTVIISPDSKSPSRPKP